MDQSGGDSHRIHLAHQGTDPFFIPEDIGEIRELASDIVVGDAQVIPISMPSGEDDIRIDDFFLHLRPQGQGVGHKVVHQAWAALGVAVNGGKGGLLYRGI